jgi:acetyl-CoA C-acetyltransferase
MKNKVVAIGIGNIQQHGKFQDLDEALILMDKATKKAISDSSKDIINYIDEIRIPEGFWSYKNPGKWIADNNNFKNNPTTYVSKIGILQQNLINKAVQKIQNGEINASLVVGGESRYKMIRALKEHKQYKEISINEEPDYYQQADTALFFEEEINELSMMAVGYYAIMENVYRYSKNEEISKHKIRLAKLYENFSRIASTNKNSWSNQKYTAQDIMQTGTKNSYQAFPYNKLHCTSWNVNQASALILCSEDIADKLNIPSKKRIYPLASSENNHMLALIQRENLVNPLGMKLAAKYIKNVLSSLNRDIDYCDLYSCFPIAVQMFCDSLELNQSSPLTITGGMSFAGGPLNHYVLSSTTQLIDKLRKNSNKVGLITGVSGLMTKQSYALWSDKYFDNFSYVDVTSKAKEFDKPLSLSNKNSGTATIVGYTILLDENKNKKAVIYAELNDKKRLILNSKNLEAIESMENTEWIGKKIEFRNGSLVY